MSEAVVTGALALSLLAYTVFGGADFGVGVLECFAPRDERREIRKLGERAIAPIWEANHIWLVLALVILFVAFPRVHVQLTTHLHIPLLLMLAGIIVRGTAFTFRYYDVESDPVTQRLWSVLFRVGSVTVPLLFGHLAAAMSRGDLRPTHGTFWDTYMAPWLGIFPLSVGIFTLVVFAWLAAVFLVAEVAEKERPRWRRRAARWTVVLVVSGGAVSLAAFFDEVPWLDDLVTGFWAPAAVVCASICLPLLWRSIASERVWTTRLLAGAIVTAILGGYFGANYPHAIEYIDGSALTWTASAAPKATLDWLMGSLLVASALILPGLVTLYRIFKGSQTAD